MLAAGPAQSDMSPARSTATSSSKSSPTIEQTSGPSGSGSRVKSRTSIPRESHATATLTSPTTTESGSPQVEPLPLLRALRPSEALRHGRDEFLTILLLAALGFSAAFVVARVLIVFAFWLWGEAPQFRDQVRAATRERTDLRGTLAKLRSRLAR